MNCCKKNSFLALIIFSAVFFIIGCGMNELDSVWCDRKITVNGIDDGTEWKNARYFLDFEAVTFGLLNDENTLYLMLSTRNQGIQRQITARGFTVWFDEKGEKKKNYGIRFPVGMKLPKGEIAENKEINDKGNKPDSSVNPARANEMLDAMQNEIEIIGPGKGNVLKMSIAEAQNGGIICRIGNNQGNMVYELQIPIRRTDSALYGITTTGVQTIGIGLETSQVQVENFRRPERQRSDTGGMSGGGMSEDRGGMMGRRGRQQSDAPAGIDRNQVSPPLEKWLKANLADKP